MPSLQRCTNNTSENNQSTLLARIKKIKQWWLQQTNEKWDVRCGRCDKTWCLYLQQVSGQREQTSQLLSDFSAIDSQWHNVAQSYCPWSHKSIHNHINPGGHDCLFILLIFDLYKGPHICPTLMREIYQELYYIWHKRPLGLKDELIRIRWSKGKVTVTSKNMFPAINQIKNRELKDFFPKGQRSASQPHPNSLQQHISGHYSTAQLRTETIACVWGH